MVVTILCGRAVCSVGEDSVSGMAWLADSIGCCSCLIIGGVAMTVGCGMGVACSRGWLSHWRASYSSLVGTLSLMLLRLEVRRSMLGSGSLVLCGMGDLESGIEDGRVG